MRCSSSKKESKKETGRGCQRRKALDIYMLELFWTSSIGHQISYIHYTCRFDIGSKRISVNASYSRHTDWTRAGRRGDTPLRTVTLYLLYMYLLLFFTFSSPALFWLFSILLVYVCSSGSSLKKKKFEMKKLGNGGRYYAFIQVNGAWDPLERWGHLLPGRYVLWHELTRGNYTFERLMPLLWTPKLSFDLLIGSLSLHQQLAR